MDQYRIEGDAKIFGGRVKEFVGWLFGDSKIQNRGKLDQAGGKIQHTVDGLEDTLRQNKQRRRL